jgi:hypothetical protein
MSFRSSAPFLVSSATSHLQQGCGTCGARSARPAALTAPATTLNDHRSCRSGGVHQQGSKIQSRTSATKATAPDQVPLLGVQPERSSRRALCGTANIGPIYSYNQVPSSFFGPISLISAGHPQSRSRSETKGNQLASEAAAVSAAFPLTSARSRCVGCLELSADDA